MFITVPTNCTQSSECQSFPNLVSRSSSIIALSYLYPLPSQGCYRNVERGQDIHPTHNTPNSLCHLNWIHLLCITYWAMILPHLYKQLLLFNSAFICLYASVVDDNF